MKYKYNGKIYDSIESVHLDFCAPCDCDDCKMYDKVGNIACGVFCEYHEKEAAEIMGAVAIDEDVLIQPALSTKPELTKSERERILEEAKKCVCGGRDQQYGSPENSLKAIASMWAGYLEAKGCVFPNGEELSAKDAAAMMVLFKMARVATGQTKADNWIDAAGYAACGGEIESSKENQQEDEDDENS